MFAVLPSGAIQQSEVLPGLSSTLREAMLDVVLRWADLDGAVSQLYVAVLNLDEISSADEASDMPAHAKLRAVQLRVRNKSPELGRAIGRIKKQYERMSVARDTIAHCRCVGRLAAEPERAVFLRYRRLNDGLIVDAIHLDKFREVEAFGERLWRACIDTANEFRAHYAKG